VDASADFQLSTGSNSSYPSGVNPNSSHAAPRDRGSVRNGSSGPGPGNINTESVGQNGYATENGYPSNGAYPSNSGYSSNGYASNGYPSHGSVMKTTMGPRGYPVVC